MEFITLSAVISLDTGDNRPDPEVFWHLEPDHGTLSNQIDYFVREIADTITIGLFEEAAITQKLQKNVSVLVCCDALMLPFAQSISAPITRPALRNSIDKAVREITYNIRIQLSDKIIRNGTFRNQGKRNKRTQGVWL